MKLLSKIKFLRLFSFASLIIFQSCVKDPVSNILPPAGADTFDVFTSLPKKIVSDEKEYYLFYNSDNLVTKLSKAPWLPFGPAYPISWVDSVHIYYNSNKTINRSLVKNFDGQNYFRRARFFEYSANRLAKVYEKNQDFHHGTTYDTSYELVRGPINYANLKSVDSLVYDVKGRITEIFRFLFVNRNGVTALIPANYKKLQYKTDNDSLLQLIINKDSINASFVSSIPVQEYDLTSPNPMYKHLKMLYFVNNIDLLPFGVANNFGDIGALMAFNPYFVKYMFSGSLYPVTNRIIINGKTYSSYTTTNPDPGGFSFYY
jgi:hypothetical protein